MVHIESLVIETTRHCMLKCAHCLRGDGAPRFFNAFGELENFLSLGVHIDTLAFSGGEPFLAPEILLHITELMIKHETEVDGIYIATSGVVPNTPVHSNIIVSALNKMIELLEINDIDITDDEEIPPLHIELSNSEYHIESREQYGFKIMPLLKLISKKDRREYNSTHLIPMGRAEYLATTYERYNAIIKSCEKGVVIDIDDEEDEVNIPEMYITFDGRCFPECDLSYDMMDNADAYEFKVYTLDEITKIIKKDLGGNHDQEAY